MASPFEFSYVFTVIGKIWEAMPVTLLLTFAPLFIGFLFGVPFAVIRRFNVPFAASFLKNASNILKGIPAVLLVLMINYLILKPIDYLALSYEWAKPLQTMNKIYIGIAAEQAVLQHAVPAGHPSGRGQQPPPAAAPAGKRPDAGKDRTGTAGQPCKMLSGGAGADERGCRPPLH